jgi:hypothetical protein
MSKIKPAANQRSSVRMMEIMGHASAGSQEGSPKYVASLPYRLMVPAAPCLELRRTWKKEAGIANPE